MKYHYSSADSGLMRTKTGLVLFKSTTVSVVYKHLQRGERHVQQSVGRHDVGKRGVELKV